MKHVIAGTAGHIDHGKTALVQALTGIDCDRFPEEKARGITIDIGFAGMDLGDIHVSFIDVPGHERFIKNMLAGVWGIDCVVLVVAADESVMPQTREHFDILHILGVKAGIVAVTKADLTDDDMVELVKMEIQDLVRGSFLEGAPVLPVSARSGRGLPELKQALADTAARIALRDPKGLFRLYLDRSFTIKGHGTVVTGTVISGQVDEGEEVVLQPDDKRVRVRGIEVHGVRVGQARAGQRAALNLQGLEVSEAVRGDQLLAPGAYEASYMLNVRLHLLSSADRPLKNNERVRFHLGTCEVLARVKVVGAAQVATGASALAQIRLEAPVLCFPGDRFVVRRYSPMVTIGGGVIIDGRPGKVRGSGHDELPILEKLETAGLGDQCTAYAAHSGAQGLTVAELVGRTGIHPRTIEDAVHEQVKKGALLAAPTEPPRMFAASVFENVTQACREILAAFHRENPLRWGMSREELREKALGRAPVQSARFFMDRLLDAGVLEVRGEEVRKVGHEIRLSEGERRIMAVLEETYDKAGMNPPGVPDVVAARKLDPKATERVFQLLQRSGKLVGVGGGIAFHAAQIQEVRRMLLEWRARSETISVGQFKELTGTTRKYAIPLLEYLDRERWTRRDPSGDRVILLEPGGPPAR